MKLKEGTGLLQSCGSFDSLTNKYSVSIAIGGNQKGPTVALESDFGGSFVVTLDYLSKEDLEHLESCISCMLTADTKN